MIFYMRNEIKPYLLSIDIEHDGQNIIQISGIMLKNIGKCIYQICRNINMYIKLPHSLSKFVQNYTDINEKFLEEYGVEITEAKELWHEFLADINKDDILIFSHGIFQDIEIMDESGFDVSNYELWDTYNMSKFILERDKHLTLQELVEEAGCPAIKPHNAYSDALSNLMLYSYLLKIQGDE